MIIFSLLRRKVEVQILPFVQGALTLGSPGDTMQRYLDKRATQVITIDRRPSGNRTDMPARN